MSVSLWRYTEDCNGNPCPGDCDLCNKEPEWIKDPDRPRAMRFKCPYCGGYCYDNFYADRKTIECSYNFCPHCGEEIHIKNEKNKTLENLKKEMEIIKNLHYLKFELKELIVKEYQKEIKSVERAWE